MAFSSFFALFAIAVDTLFYQPSSGKSFRTLFATLLKSPTITPLNNLSYNAQASNLAEHGLHPHYQHFLANLPQLLGPAFVLLLVQLYPLTRGKTVAIFSNPRFTSALGGATLLSLFPHQEPRFLLPCVPLLLTCVRIPTNRRHNRLFWISWIVFNSFFAVLMGIYHQGGIIPTQIAIPNLVNTYSAPGTTSATVFWWKTYPAPRYLLGSPNTTIIDTVDLMGVPPTEVVARVDSNVPQCHQLFGRKGLETFLVAPLSAPSIDWLANGLGAEKIWTYRRHINLDDLDIGEDGILGTLSRVVGRRGISVWKMGRACD